MKRLTAVAVAFALATFAVACEEEEDTSTPDGTCENAVNFAPEDGATGVYYRGAIEIDFTTAEDDAAVTVTGPDGDVTGAVSWDGDTLIFEPDMPLSASTEYTVALDYSCGEPSVSWTTSEVGAAVDAADLTGKVYSIDIASGHFVEPAGIETVVQQYAGDWTILVGVESASATEIDVIGAMGVDGTTEQDVCFPTIDMPAASFDANPYFAMEMDELTLSVSSYTATIEDFSLTGSFSPDGSYLVGGEVMGTVDTRPLVPYLVAGGLIPEDSATDDAICNLVAGMNLTCGACPTDGEEYCLSVHVDSIEADAVSGSITPITEVTDPSCAE